MSEASFSYLPHPLDELRLDGITLSAAYQHTEESILVVDQPAIFETPFSYKRYCQKQNEWMRQYKKVYRFIADDPDLAGFLDNKISEKSYNYSSGRTVDRENVLADPTPLEFRFEECFVQAFGDDALKYLKREYAFLTEDGATNYVDYALFKKDGTWIAIEENGLSFHHPFIIKNIKYQQILKKQNSIIAANGLVYRWDTESLSNQEKIIDELKEFVGDLGDYLVQYSLLSQRGFSLHEHQSDYLTALSNDRMRGKRSALVVLPTGTGKTVIALEDIKQMARSIGKVNVLVLAPLD